MNDRGAPNGSSSWFGALLLLAVTVIVCLAVLIINRGPLYYFDTGGYFKQGDTALSFILPEEVLEEDGASGDKNDPDAANLDDEDKTANGSRSMVYALMVAIFWRADALSGIAFVNIAVVLASSWLVARVAKRLVVSDRSTMLVTTVPLLAGATTSLGFYIAYVMPDMFAPVMLILIAAVVAMGHKMRLMELVVALVLAAIAVILHPSHLGIAILMLPFAILSALLRRGYGHWLAVGFIACLAAIGMFERKAFEFATENATDKEVHYTPHITARLIEDGPGLSFLEDHCPQAGLATCALYEALSWSDNPYRLTASHIIFKHSHDLGSFRRLDAEDQASVANEQRAFFLKVLADRPLSVFYAFAKNATAQLTRNSVRMTIPDEGIIRNAKALSGLSGSRLEVIADGGVLARDRAWIDTADRIHTTIYLVSFILIIGLLIWPGKIAPPLKIFALFLLIGIAMNALVCGGVSQPADRYGARVAWLLPFTAAFLLLFVSRYKTRPDTGVHP